MDSFIVRKRRREETTELERDGDSTDFKLTLLTSLHPQLDSGVLLEALLASEGSVENASALLKDQSRSLSPERRKKFRSTAQDQQASLSRFNFGQDGGDKSPTKLLTKKGKTLHLYAPRDVEEHTPCSIIHNFLPAEEADALLRDLLEETPTFERQKFKLFDRVVESPHTICFYVDSMGEAERQKSEYYYNGRLSCNVRQSLPSMLKVSAKVKEAVNVEVQRRIKEKYPDGKKLKYQSPKEWQPNCSFVNCYDGAQESVGYHSDRLTYLGPRAIIGSLSLGVSREFRVRRVIARDEDVDQSTDSKDNDAEENSASKTNQTTPALDRADHQGQIAIHLPHNSLLVMHAEMQEEWKHSIAPAQVIDPHQISGNKRINITYRCYKENLHPKFTPRCKCGIPCVLRCVQRKKGNRGRYMWSCHSHHTPGEAGCSYFQWAEFDDEGNPPWANKGTLKTDAG